MAMKKTKLKCVSVEWVDSSSEHGWATGEGSSKQSLACHSVGYVVEDTPERLVISGHYAEEVTHSWHSPMAIPKVAIVSLKRFKAPK